MRNFFRSERSGSAKRPDHSRRSFFWKLGAGVSAAFASTAGMARAGSPDDASVRLALLEDKAALRRLHRAFERAMDQGRYGDVVEMFAADAEVIFNGGVFRNRTGGVSRLLRNRFQSGKTGKTIDPAPGFELAADQQNESLEVAPDRLTAKAVFPYSIQVGQPIESETSLAGMARLQGSNVQTWWEGGAYELSYVRDDVEARWKIGNLEYRTLARADYRPGRTCATPISVPSISRRYPEDPQGPDALVQDRSQ